MEQFWWEVVDGIVLGQLFWWNYVGEYCWLKGASGLVLVNSVGGRVPERVSMK